MFASECFYFQAILLSWSGFGVAVTAERWEIQLDIHIVCIWLPQHFNIIHFKQQVFTFSPIPLNPHDAIVQIMLLDRRWLFNLQQQINKSMLECVLKDRNRRNPFHESLSWNVRKFLSENVTAVRPVWNKPNWAFSQIKKVWWKPAEELGRGSNRSEAINTTKAVAVFLNGCGHQ